MKKLLIFILCIMSCISLISFKKSYTGPKAEIEKKQAMDTFSNKLGKKYNLTFLMLGSKSLVHSNTRSWSTSFVSNNTLTLDEGRALITCLIHDLWTEFQTNPVYTHFMEYHNTISTLKIDTLSPHLIGIKVAFWDANVDRPLHPYLACILVADEKIQYFYADPKTQALQEPIVETFDEAFVKTAMTLKGSSGLEEAPR